MQGINDLYRDDTVVREFSLLSFLQVPFGQLRISAKECNFFSMNVRISIAKYVKLLSHATPLGFCLKAYTCFRSDNIKYYTKKIIKIRYDMKNNINTI